MASSYADRYRAASRRSRLPGALPTQREGAQDFQVPRLPQEDQGGGGFMSRLSGLVDILPQPIQDIGSGAWRVVQEIDRPISERLGFEIPDMRGPIDEVGNVLLEELTRPTNWISAIAMRSPAAAAMRSQSRLIRMGGRLIEPVAPNVGPFARTAIEAGVTAGARGAATAINTALPEDTPAPLRVTLGIGAGLVGGIATAGAMSRVAPDAFVSPIISRTPEGSEVYAPPEGAAELFGIQPIIAGNGVRDEIRNAAARTVGRYFGMQEIDARGRGATMVLRNGRDSVENTANAVGHALWSTVAGAFDIDLPPRIRIRTGQHTYQIKSLADEAFPAGPTIQDLAARLPNYWARLTEPQRTAIMHVRDTLMPFQALDQKVGGSTGLRKDIIKAPEGMDVPDGFYIPRGDAMIEFAQDGAIVRPGQHAKAGHRQTAEYDSMAQGIAAGETYVAPLDAFSNYIKRVGLDTVNMHVGSYFKNLKDPETGIPLASTSATRVAKPLQAKWKRINRTIQAERKKMQRDVSRLVELRRATRAANREADRIADEVIDSTLNQTDSINLSDLRAAERSIQDAIEDGRTLVAAITRNADLSHRASAALEPHERNILKKTERMNRLLDEADSLAHRVDDTTLSTEERLATGQRIEEMYEKAAELNEEISELVDGAIDMAARAEDLVAKGDVYRNLDDATREELTRAFALQRDLISQDLQSRVSARELEMLERYQSRALDAAQSAGEREAAIRARMDHSRKTYDKARKELDDFAGTWREVRNRARRVAPGEGTISLPGLEGHGFPAALARTVNTELEKQLKLQGSNSAILNSLNAFNSMYRGMRASLDMSGPGIQGLVGMSNNPTGWWKAMTTSWKAWADQGDTLLGSYINDFDTNALSRKSATSQLWASQGNLRIGGAKHEYAIGKGMPERIAQTTPYKQANQAFGYFGDAMRLKWADSMLEGELAKGRTLQEIIDSGDFRRIGESVNRMTGWSSERAFGNWGDLFLFAPRFLQSRLETMGKAIMGLGPHAGIDEQRALRSMMQMASVGVGLTMFLNWAFSGFDDPMDVINEMDWKPLRDDGSWNSNFLRVRAAGRDWSMFGPWDSLMRAVVETASGRPHNALRGMSSGVVNSTWTALQGQTLMGDERFRTPEGTFAGFMEMIIPFSGEGLAESVGAMTRGEPGGAAGILGDFIGAKSSPVTPYEERNNAARNMYGKDWTNLTGQERDALEAEHPEIISRIQEQLEHRAAAGDQTAMLQVRRNEIDAERIEAEREALALYLQGDYSANDLNAAISTLMREASIKKQELDVFTDNHYEPGSPEGRALSAWYDTYRQAEDAAGQMNWELHEQLQAELIASIRRGDYGDSERMMQVIEQRRTADHPEELQWFIEYRNLISESGYYDEQNVAFERYARRVDRMLGTEGSSYGDLVRGINAALISGDTRTARRLSQLKKRIDQDTQQRRTRLRRRNPELDVALVSTGRVTEPLTGRARRLLREATR